MHKQKKSAGENGIGTELIKYGEQTMQIKVCEILEEVWEQGELPERLKNAVVIPVHKKVHTTLCQNFRAIALLDTTCKVLATIIKGRLQSYAEESIGEYQCGFKYNRSVTDQIYTLKELQTICYEYKIELHAIFIDFKRAHDSVNRKWLYESMHKLDIPQKLIEMVKMALKGSKNRLRIRGKLSNTFEVSSGLRQGDPLPQCCLTWSLVTLTDPD